MPYDLGVSLSLAAKTLLRTGAGIILTLLTTAANASGPCPYLFPSGVEGIVVGEDAVELYSVGGDRPEKCPIVGHKGSIVTVDCGYSRWSFQLIASVPDAETDIMVIGDGSQGAPLSGPLYKRCDVDPESLGYD